MVINLFTLDNSLLLETYSKSIKLNINIKILLISKERDSGVSKDF
jgi:hypothetical protein